MKISYAWLKEYLGDSIPTPEEIEDLITFHSFEIEGHEEVAGDIVIDVDVLPNRSSDCLCHRGIAREVATIADVPFDDPLREDLKVLELPEGIFNVTIKDEDLCQRFSAAVISGVKVGPSPAWLKERLEALGQRSINNIVDATNYVMFDLGQPLHAFDASKLEKDKEGAWHIEVRTAKTAEKITTLDEAEYTLDNNLLITDGTSGTALGIAGVKGGKAAEVDTDTTDLILEAAHFDPTHVRKTSQALKLRTDASLRFENNPSAELTLFALDHVVKLILEIAGGEHKGTLDVYPQKEEQKEVSVTVDEVNKLLGTHLTESDVESTLKRLGFMYTARRGNFTVTVPFERTDLQIAEDLVEEVGRVYGYRNIEAAQLPSLKSDLEVNKRFYYAEATRNVLVEVGFSEVYTYTITERGEVELANPFTSDKSALRTSLKEGLRESLKVNSKNAPLLGLEIIKIFELGPVFKKDDEYMELGVGILPSGKNIEAKQAEVYGALREALKERVGVVLPDRLEDGVATANFDELIQDLPLPKTYEPVTKELSDISYEPVSQYPFALRDIAVWTTEGTTPEDVIQIVEKETGDLLVRHTLFDRFEKDGKISYAFHLVFQSDTRTLSEDDLNSMMEKVTTALNQKEGWEVR